MEGHADEVGEGVGVGEAMQELTRLFFLSFSFSSFFFFLLSRLASRLLFSQFGPLIFMKIAQSTSWMA